MKKHDSDLSKLVSPRRSFWYHAAGQKKLRNKKMRTEFENIIEFTIPSS